MRILGECFGVDIKEAEYKLPGFPKEKYTCVTLLIEDDGNWLDKTRNETFSFNAFWLADLISVLKQAKLSIKKPKTKKAKKSKRK